MFDERNQPSELLFSLKRFLHLWYGDKPAWHGTSEDKLATVQLPTTLRELYRLVGNWPADNWWGSAFAKQDVLLPFEMLTIVDGKLLFAFISEGGPKIGTEREGADPPVWYREENGPWIQFCDSLAQFIVTLCLQETVFNAKHRGTMPQISKYFESKNRHVAPLWLDGPFVPFNNSEPRRYSFHLVDWKYLVFNDGWCGTNLPEPWRDFPELFKPEEPPRESVVVRRDESIVNLRWIPNLIKKNIVSNWARQHAEQAAFHSQRAELFRKIAETIDETVWPTEEDQKSRP